MIEATSCGGVVIFRGKILLLYKNYRNKYEGWVLPKGTVEEGEQHNETALREVKEETGVSAQIIKYVGKSNYTFNTSYDVVNKDVHFQRTGGYRIKGCTLVSDDGGQLLQQATTGRIFYGFRILQISRGVPSVKIPERKTDIGSGVRGIYCFEAE